MGAVSYLNTKPLIYGFEKGLLADEISLLFDYPSNIARGLLDNSIDIGLVPVAVIPALSHPHILPGYGIATDGEVASVALFSDVPLEEIQTILLDYQSRTSVALLKLLLQKYWKINPRLEPAGAGYEETIGGTTAGLVIGDRALVQRRRSVYIFDLGSAWKDMTGLPFVFAAWVSNRPFDPGFEKRFSDAVAEGLQQLDAVIAQNPFAWYDLHTYYTQNISYPLDAAKMKGLELFLSYLRQTAP